MKKYEGVLCTCTYMYMYMYVHNYAALGWYVWKVCVLCCFQLSIVHELVISQEDPDNVTRVIMHFLLL